MSKKPKYCKHCDARISNNDLIGYEDYCIYCVYISCKECNEKFEVLNSDFLCEECAKND